MDGQAIRTTDTEAKMSRAVFNDVSESLNQKLIPQARQNAAKIAAMTRREIQSRKFGINKQYS